VDGDLPVWNGNFNAYADQSPNGSIWAAILEKAYAFFRTGAGTYASLNSGWMANVFSDLGLGNTGVYSSDSLLSKIDDMIKAKKAVTYATASVPSGTPLISYHAYTVDHINRDSTGAIYAVTLRNPWGIDGAGSDGHNDGYVTITAQQAAAAFNGVVAGTV